MRQAGDRQVLPEWCWKKIVSCARVSLIVGLLESFFGDVGVDLRCRERGMAEHRLHAAEIGTRIEQMCRKTVTKFVRAHCKGNTAVFEAFAQHQVDRLLGDARAALAEKERPRGDSCFLAIALDRCKRGFANRHNALL